MAKQVLTDLDFNNVSRITNLPDGVQPQEAATVAQLNAAVEGLAQKDDVKVATQSNINLAAPGTTIDGIVMAVNDRVLVKAQTDNTENGIYIFNGDTSPMTRSPDGDVGTELNSALVPVNEGTDAGLSFRQTTVNPTLGVSPILWVVFGTVAPAATESTAGIAEIATQAEVDAGTDDQRFVTPAKLANFAGLTVKFGTDIGDGSNTQYTVTHNLNSEDINYSIRNNAGDRDYVIADVRVIDANNIQINFSSAPTLNQLRVVVFA